MAPIAGQADGKMTKPKKPKRCPTCGCEPIFPKPFDSRVWFYYVLRRHTQVETAAILGVSRDVVARSIRRMKDNFPEMLSIRTAPLDPPPRPTLFFESVHSTTE